ncbi:glutathione S-transferase family protein [Azohydromonas aeria]|uniref:glutathione S-transferase family protein n=1 Tax=Azohydromonas aeria TaxID=2590212 RepID=UPI0012FC067A|nr:glutathione S-transferase family protein [Azohydromonas aeria]
MRLVIGNKNYSSWSMRPWVLMKHFGMPFEEVKLRFNFTPGSDFYRQLAAFTPAGKVPVLLDGELAVWDTLAIAEYLAEKFPQHAVWPRDAAARARARSVCAEMHAGFTALRGRCGQNLEASLPDVGARLLAEDDGALRRDLDRVVALWQDALRASGGPFLFGGFSAADAYYVPVVGRLRTYGLPVPDDVADYMARVWATPAVAAWVADALAEADFLDFEEPYRSAR